jgi:hypothetical protein
MKSLKYNELISLLKSHNDLGQAFALSFYTSVLCKSVLKKNVSQP